jgi:hypothetical protein
MTTLTWDDRRRQAAIDTARYVNHEMKTWVDHVKQFGYTRTPGDKMPRANACRPYRFAVQDVIFALTALRHAKEYSAVEIDVFLACDPKYESLEVIPKGQDLYPYEPLAAARALTLMVLSEAFRCSGSLRLRFTNNVERTEGERQQQQQEEKKRNQGRVPLAIVHLAEALGVAGIDPESGVLEPAAAGLLYAFLTGFPPSLLGRIQQLAGQGLLSIERACYLVQHGVWTIAELEGLILSCPYPDLVLDGEVQPEQRHLYHHAQVQARTALLGGVLDRALQSREAPFDGKLSEPLKTIKGRVEGGTPQADQVNGKPAPAGRDVEDNDRALKISFDAELCARRYELAPIEFDWNLPAWQPFAARGKLAGTPIGRVDTLIALLRPRDAAGLRLRFAADLKIAANASGPGRVVALVVPQDFNDLLELEQKELVKSADAASVALLVCPESARTLDGYAREKLNRSRVLPE